MRKRNILVAVSACLAAMALIAPAASADPNPPGSTRLLAGGGSDTTEKVLNDFSNGRTAPPTFGGIPTLGSYDTLLNSPPPPPAIKTKATIPGSDCVLPRPQGSGAGVTALINERQAAATNNRRPCLDFARSSAFPSSAGAGTGLSFVPFAVDAISVVARGNSLLPTNFTPGQLNQLYTCQLPIASFRPLLPQANSGTRSTFLGFIGLSNAAVAPFIAAPGQPITQQRCISDQVPVADLNTAGTVPLEENVGNALNDPRQVVPFSTGQFSAQQSGAIPDRTGTTKLRRIDGQIPSASNGSFPFRRLLYNVIPTQFTPAAPGGAEDPDYGPVFSPTGAICSNPGVIIANGFTPLTGPTLGATGCGDEFSFRAGPTVTTPRPTT